MYISFSKSLRLLLLNIYRKKIGLRALCSLRTFFKKISDFSCIIEKGVVMIHILVQYDWNVENNTILNVIGHKYTYLLTITKTKFHAHNIGQLIRYENNHWHRSRAFQTQVCKFRIILEFVNSSISKSILNTLFSYLHFLLSPLYYPYSCVPL